MPNIRHAKWLLLVFALFFIDQSCTGARNRQPPREYVNSIEDIKAVADKAFDEGDFASAGKTYNVLLKKHSCFTGFVQRLSFDRAYLNTKLSHCKKSLSTQGFQEYRKGNLGEAVAAWRSLLAIDPDNASVKEVIRTATLQQKNLQKLTAGR